MASCSLKIENADNNDKILCTIIPSISGPKKPVNVIISYDRSYSMSNAANPNGDEITKYYSKNDLGKHSMSIVINSLGPNDTIQIITYDSVVETVLPRTAMNDSGKILALDSIKKIEPRGCTELWKGLKAAMDAALITSNQLGDSTVIMITDGEPSNSPVEGEVETLKNYRKETHNNCRLHTIGIGYDIKSKLLADLTDNGQFGGSFIFIPDGSMMITSWVNLLANEKNIIGKNLTININETILNLGTIKYGQNKTFLVNSSEFKNITSIQYDSMNNTIIHIPITDTISKNNNNVIFEVVRTKILKAMNDILKFSSLDINKSLDILRASVSEAFEMIDSHPIIDDMVGEISLGFQSNATVKKWGAHYIRSLITAHTNRDCLNFKDPGLKIYESDMIKKTREEVDAIANAIEVPQPSIRMYTSSSNGNQYTTQTVSQFDFQSSYNNASGGCFGADGTIILKNGTFKFIKDLKKGDILDNGAIIKCVIIFHECDTITIQDGMLEITPWHPILDGDTWVFPSSRKVVNTNSNQSVYNFILDSKHIININGINCCTLAHGFTGPVIQHEYYGTQNIINDLKVFPGYSYGLVNVFKENKVFNNDKTQIIGYKI